MPDSPNFPYRRYERLPPIHQFSIESDSDLSETAELIEEYEVFDPSKPRPKVILVIGKEAQPNPSLALFNMFTHTLYGTRTCEVCQLHQLIHYTVHHIMKE